MSRLWEVVRHHGGRLITLGGLSGRDLAEQLWERIFRDDLFGHATHLSYYFLLALFPFLIFVSAALGYIFAAKQDLYLHLLSYLQNVMPATAFDLLSGTLKEISQEADGGKVILGLLFSTWIASSGMKATIEGLNMAYAVEETRPWWRRRLVAIALTITLGVLVGVAAFLILASRALAVGIGSYFPMVEQAGALSTVTQWVMGMLFLLLALTLIFRFAPNLRQPRIEANLPGAALSLVCWLAASAGFKVYLFAFGTFARTYGSLGAVIVLLIWLYASGAAILIGGELNSIIWPSVVRRRRS